MRRTLPASILVFVVACGGEAGPADDAAAATRLEAGVASRIRGGTEPAWAPDGSLVFSAFSGDQRDLYVRGPDGADERRLTTSPGYDMLPAISSTGRLAYFEADEDGVRLVVRDSLDGESRGVDAGGLSLALTRPAWAPDGTITVAVATGGEGELDLVSLDPAGGPPGTVLEAPGYDSQPAWSPDGRLAFVTRRGGRPGIWVLEPSGDTTRLTGYEGAEEGPAWSPDGRFVAYVSAREGDRDLYLVPGGGGDARRLTSGSGRAHAPAWSPDGTTIAYSIIASGRTDDDLMLLEVARAPASAARPEGGGR